MSGTDRLRQVSREIRNGLAAIILVAASIVAAFAAALGLTSWVAIAAAVTAVLSGAQVLRTELVVPMRTKAVENATVRVASRRDELPVTFGTAFQVASNRWITAWHVVRDGIGVFLILGSTKVEAQVLYQDPDADLAVLSTNSDWAWRASLTPALPEPGDRLKVIGWVRGKGSDRRPLRVALEYLVQGPVADDLLVLTGPNPQIGFSGAPAVHMRTGRVVGILVSFIAGDPEFPGGPTSLDVTQVIPISALPAEFR